MAYLGRKGQTAPLASADLPTNSISTDHLIANSVTSAKIGVDVIVAEDIANNAITVAEIADDAVTADKLANSINTDIATGVAALPKAGGTMTGALTVGADDAGHDVIFHGATASCQVLWDESADTMFVKGRTDGSNIFVAGDTAYSYLNIGTGETIFNQDSRDQDFRVESDGNTHALFIEGSSGNVGIGTASPSCPLHVEGTGIEPVVRIKSMSSTHNGYLRLENDQGDNWSIGTVRSGHSLDGTLLFSGGSADVVFNTSGKIGLGCEPHAAITCGDDTMPITNSYKYLGSSSYRWNSLWATNANNASDRTLKTNIEDCVLGVDFINTLKPVSFDWKAQNRSADAGKKWGLIAQDVLETEMVDTVKGEEGSYSVSYDHFIAPLIKAIQELSAKVTALENA